MHTLYMSEWLLETEKVREVKRRHWYLFVHASMHG